MMNLCVVSERRYKVMRCAAIVLPIVSVLLAVAFGTAIRALTADCVPDDGVWYCEELNLEVNFNNRKIIATTSEETLNVCNYGVGAKIVKVYRIIDTKTAVLENGEQEKYEEYETVYLFLADKLRKNHWYVHDADGNKYVFVRK